MPILSGTTPSSQTPEKAAALLRPVNLLGNVNIAFTGGVLGTTSILAIKASESGAFSVVSPRRCVV